MPVSRFHGRLFLRSGHPTGAGGGVLSEEATRLIRAAIRSVWALELLLLLRRERRAWTAADLTRALYSSNTVVGELLIVFRAEGLVEEVSGGTVRYAPASPELDLAAEEIERLHAERPLAVVKAILAAPNDRLRSFSDAFKLKRD
jgi:hypothetical protein